LAVKAIGLATVLASVALWVWLGWRQAAGFAGGVLAGAGLLAALVVVVDRLVVPESERHGPRWPWLLLHTGKLLVVIVGAYLLIVVARASIAGFALGYAVAMIGLFVYLGSRRALSARPHA